MDTENGKDRFIGQQVGNYVVTRKMGEGGMGAVYLAKHPRIEREVAIKVLNQRVQPQMLERFNDEAKAASKIRHPNIIEIFDLGETEDGWPYCVMEVLEGRELLELMESVIAARGCMTPGEVLPLLEQICAGLQAAHEAGIIHRDLKPENIFVLDEQPLALKILDFGIAKLMDNEAAGVSKTRTGMVFGTPLFISPEQAAGQAKNTSARSDIYSLGVMIYWMLAGKPPFNDESFTQLLIMHVHNDPPPLQEVAPQVPQELCALVMECLAKEPDGRPDTARELAERFAAVAREQGIVARAVTIEPDEDVGTAETMCSQPPEDPATAKTGYSEPPQNVATAKTRFSQPHKKVAPAGATVDTSAGEMTAMTARPPTNWTGGRRLALAVGALVLLVGAGVLIQRSMMHQPRQPTPAVTGAAAPTGQGAATPAPAPVPVPAAAPEQPPPAAVIKPDAAVRAKVAAVDQGAVRRKRRKKSRRKGRKKPANTKGNKPSKNYKGWIMEPEL